MTGFGAFSIAACVAGSDAPLGGFPNSVMSAPAMKVRPSQISTMALALGLAPAFSIPSLMPSRTAAESAFTGGEFTVSTAMSPSRLRSVTELMAAMVAPLTLVFARRIARESLARPDGRPRACFRALCGLGLRQNPRRIREDALTLFDLTGKVAVVTGSSRGIGRAIVERMAE